MIIKEAMSKKSMFLLTEIGMGLLGNNFYDVDGNQVNDMETLKKYTLDPEDYVPETRNLKKILCISDVCFQAADNVEGEIIDLDSVDDDSFKSESEKRDEPPPPSTQLLIPAEVNSDTIINTVSNEETEVNNLPSVVQPTAIISSDCEEDRIKYILDLAKEEIKNIKATSIKRKAQFLNENIEMYKKALTSRRHRPVKELTKVFFAREKKMLENESDALISFMKIVKKVEFPSESPNSLLILNKVSNDIMKAKEIMCWTPNV